MRVGLRGPITTSPGWVKMEAFSCMILSTGALSVQISWPDVRACMRVNVNGSCWLNAATVTGAAEV